MDNEHELSLSREQQEELISLRLRAHERSLTIVVSKDLLFVIICGENGKPIFTESLQTALGST